MGCYRLVAFGFEKLFDLPIYWTVDYTEKNLYKEVDFLSEGRNTERASLDLVHRRDVYVPKVSISRVQ
jgi:aarF domain-containing kinase